MREIKGISRDNINIDLERRIDKNSEVYFIDKFVESLVSKYPNKYNREEKVTGRFAFSNKIYLKVYLYSYLNGIRGSRSIEKECQRNLELIWLLEDLHPSYWSINNFRSKNKDKIKEMTIEFRKFLKEFKYIDDGLTAYDGSKIKADADKNSYSVDYLKKKISQIDTSMDEYIKSSDEIDSLEELVKEYESNKVLLETKFDDLESENLSLKRKLLHLKEKRDKLSNHQKIIESEIKKKEFVPKMKKQKGKGRRSFPVKRVKKDIV